MIAIYIKETLNVPPKSKKIRLPMYAAPELWAVLYVEPMIGKYKGQGRLCNNCMMWVSGERSCVIHDRDIEITGNMVCGYHVPGDPMREWMHHPNIEPVKPEYSGLEDEIPKEGTMCGNCYYYVPAKKKLNVGFCSAVTKNNDKEPLYKAKVSYYGCCARWEGPH